MPISYRSAQALIKRGDATALVAALDGGLNPDFSNENGWSLLMLTAVEGSVPLGQILLDRGADPTKKNSRGDTALSIATSRQHTAFLELLPQ